MFSNVQNSRWIILILLLSLILAACSSITESIPSLNSPVEEVTNGESAAETQIVNPPTPRPTATPDTISRTAEDVVEIIGIENTRFLSLFIDDWINLGISLLIILVSYLLIAPLFTSILRWLSRQVFNEAGEKFVRSITREIRWLIVTMAAQYGVMRLPFISSEIKYYLEIGFFTFYILLIYLVLRKTVDAGFEWYLQRLPEGHSETQAKVLLPILKRITGVLLLVLALTFLLERLGVNILALTTVLGLGGLAISLAAQDTFRDVISGFIIMLDQPFRIGDRIKIKEEDTWGDVINIGTRTTRIRTLDNRLVIVPNSVIGNNQIVNYSYPDPTYRMEIEVGVAYGADTHKARRSIIEGIRTVEGVMESQPVEALFLRFGDSALIFLVRWWMSSYTDIWRMYDEVNQAIYDKLSAEGIEIPYVQRDVNLNLQAGVAQELAQAWHSNGNSGV